MVQLSHPHMTMGKTIRGSDQNHLREKEIQEGKVVVWRGFTNSEKRREMKGEGKRERYTQLNAELQKIAKRDKKAFLNEQYKEIQENNRMRKNGDLFKKIGEIKGTFHARMGTIKYRKSMDLTEAKEIKKRWQGYTEELYKKDLNDLDNLNGVVTHLEPNILECKVKWFLGIISTNKASEGDGIPAEPFKS